MSLPTPITEFHSELAWDALLDAMPLASRLVQSPCTAAELQEEFPSLDAAVLGRHLSRLVRSGIVIMDGLHYRATSRFLFAYRQDSQIAVLSELFLPIVLGIAHDPAQGLLLHLDLDLNIGEQESLLSGPVHELFAELSALADEPGDRAYEQSMIIFGTPSISTKPPGLDRTLEVLRSAARDRTDSKLKDRSVLAFLQARFPSPDRAANAILNFENKWKSRTVAMETASYNMVLGLGQRHHKVGDLR